MTRGSGPSLWPREHGAYAQMGAGLAAGLLLAPGWRGWAQALATVGLFLASEPLLVLLGRRGPADPGPARWRFLGLALVTAVGLLAAWIGRPARDLAALVPASLLGVALFGLFLAGRERSAAGESLAALAFAAAALPVAAAGGAPGRTGAGLALLLGGVFVLGTAMVHGHLRALRRGGAPGPRRAAFLAGLALAGAAYWQAGRGLVPGLAWLAFLPMTGVAGIIWLAPPAPRRLKGVGWAAAACAVAGGGLAAVLLRGR